MIKKILTVMIIFSMIFSIVFAVDWIYSNIIGIQVCDYTLTMTADKTIVIKNEIVTFSVYLTKNSLPYSGATIELFYVDGISTELTGITDELGYCEIQWNATEVNSLILFKAGYHL